MTSPTNQIERFTQSLDGVIPSARLLTDPADCLPYGYDNSRRVACPDAVVIAESVADIQAAVAAAAEHKVPLTTRGRATNTVGGTVPVAGGVVLSLERLNTIKEIRPDDRLAVVEAGVLNGDLQAMLAPEGFFWPPDPTSAAYSSIGGNLACNAAGPRAVKYGTCRDNILGLSFVDGRGKLIKTGVYTTKGVVGYDLTRLLVGSEGTLGIIVEAVLKIVPLPAEKRTLRAMYADISGASAAVSRIMAQPETPCALEFIDAGSIEVIRKSAEANNEAVDMPDGSGAMLMIEVDGQGDALDAAEAAVSGAVEGDGLLELRHARTDAEITALWKTRKALSPGLRKLASKKINEDVVVPVSLIPKLIAGLDALSDKHGVKIVNFGHAGNGNIHCNLLGEEEDLPRMHACLDEAFDLVLSLDGTLSGEHGVGIEKRPYIEREIAPEAIALMRGLKRVFDPAGILNPGKLLPEA